MKVTVIGKEKMQGISKKGNEYKGSIVHFVFLKSKCEGSAAENTFIDNSLMPYEKIMLSQEYDLDRDGRGYIIGFDMTTPIK